MPLYEYRCVKCGTQLEKLRKFSDPPLTRCEKCGGKLERLLSSPAFKFKGTGWYVNDYARKTSDGDREKKEKETTDRAASDKGGKPHSEKATKPPVTETSPSKEHSTSAKSRDSKSHSRR